MIQGVMVRVSHVKTHLRKISTCKVENPLSSQFPTPNRNAKKAINITLIMMASRPTLPSTRRTFSLIIHIISFIFCISSSSYRMVSNLPIANAFTSTSTNTLFTSCRIIGTTSSSKIRNTCLFSLKPAAIPLMDSGT